MAMIQKMKCTKMRTKMTNKYRIQKYISNIIEKGTLQRPDKKGMRRTKWCFLGFDDGNNLCDLLAVLNTFVIDSNKSMSDKCKVEYSDKFVKLFIGDNIEIMIHVVACSEKDLIDMRCMEYTGAFILEEVPSDVVSLMLERLRRFPHICDGGPSWCGIIKGDAILYSNGVDDNGDWLK